jgi:hypothetical protein
MTDELYFDDAEGGAEDYRAELSEVLGEANPWEEEAQGISIEDLMALTVDGDVINAVVNAADSTVITVAEARSILKRWFPEDIQD